MTCTKQQLETGSADTHTHCCLLQDSGSGDTLRSPLTLCLAPFKLQIVLRTLFRTRKDRIVLLFDVLGHIICSNRSDSPALAQTDAGLFDRDATCDSHGDMQNTLTWSVTQGSRIGNRGPLFLFPEARGVVMQGCN